MERISNELDKNIINVILDNERRNQARISELESKIEEIDKFKYELQNQPVTINEFRKKYRIAHTTIMQYIKDAIIKDTSFVKLGSRIQLYPDRVISDLKQHRTLIAK
jgi:hypothetical protein